MFFALGLVLLSFAAAQQIHDVQVSSTDGTTLTFSPRRLYGIRSLGSYLWSQLLQSANPGDQVVFHLWVINLSSQTYAILILL